MADGRLEMAVTAFEESNSTVQLWSWQGAPNNRWRERYTMRSPKENTFFGYDILIADINADNKDDLLIGEPYYSGEKSETGLLTIFKGTDSLLDWNTKFDLIFGTEGVCSSRICHSHKRPKSGWHRRHFAISDRRRLIVSTLSMPIIKR